MIEVKIRICKYSYGRLRYVHQQTNESEVNIRRFILVQISKTKVPPDDSQDDRKEIMTI